MHDFIQSLAFNCGRALLLTRTSNTAWVQRGIMRSFGEDGVVAAYRSAQPAPARTSHKSRIRNRK
jgi:hypothetical protein